MPVALSSIPGKRTVLSTAPSIKEVAQQWGITEKSVYSIRQRARAVMLDYIKIGA